MATAIADEGRELALIDKVEFKIALAEQDSKLSALLNTYLPPLLLKLQSPSSAVRQKVIQVCQQVNTRVKPQTLRLPVAALIKQAKENDSSLIRHFDLLYAQQGVTRLTSDEQAELFPILVAGIGSLNATAANGSAFMHLLLRSLSHYRLPPKGSPENDSLKQKLAVDTKDITYLSHWLGKLMLLRMPVSAHASAGLSSQEIAFLSLEGKQEAWAPSAEIGLNLTEIKVNALNFLASGLFTEEERLLPVLLASAEPNSRISEAAEDLLKRALSATSLDSEEFAKQLFDIYYGTKASGDVPFTPAVSVRLRTRILGVLTRISKSSGFPHQIIRLVEEDLLQDFVVSAEAVKTDREIGKLRSAIIVFLTLTARRASADDLNSIARPIIKSLRLFIEQEAQSSRSLEIRQVRGNSFEVIGLLAAANKALVVEPELELVTWLFQSLGQEADKDVLVSIEQALSSTIRCFQIELSATLESALASLLLRHLKQDVRNNRNVRYAAVRFANRCLTFQNVVARFIDILMLGNSADASHEALEEAKLGLDPYRYRLSHLLDRGEGTSSAGFVFPAFQDMVRYIFWDQDAPMDDSIIHALSFCRQAMIWNGLHERQRPIELTTDWDRRLDLVVNDDLNARQALREYVASIASASEERSALLTIFNTTLQALSSTAVGLKGRRECGSCLVELLVLFPTALTDNLLRHRPSLETVILSNDLDCRAYAAQAYGLLACRIPTRTADIEQSIRSLLDHISQWKGANGALANEVHGALLATSDLLSRRVYIDRTDKDAQEGVLALLPLVVEVIKDGSDTVLLDGGFSALGQLCLFYAITSKQLLSLISLPLLLEKISNRANAGSEKAILTLGHLPLIFEEGEELSKIIEQIHKLHELRQAESQFSVGEALICAASGWESGALLKKLDLDGPVPSGPIRKITLESLVERIFKDVSNTKPSLRKASVLWLLCFVQFGGDLPQIQARLRKLQAVFKRCLSDRDELIQESASRGLGLVYEKGGRDIKDDLVRDLVGSFSSDRADTTMSGTVTEDTLLFEPGAMPTGENQSVSTYKDIMSLASEVGDSSLVYRFMNLASSDALWSSRAAFGRFGLSSVLSDSSTEGYLAQNPKLYPKLYRYRFDPTPKVRNAMNEIWNALVKDSAGTISKHFEAIIDDLLINILGKEWRVRQACCAALADLIQGRELEKINPYLDKLWTSCFKVLDDIKGSVRQAAADLSRVLTNIVLRTLEADAARSANATKMLESVIPFLFSPSGLESSADEVKASSLKTLLDITKKAKPETLRPFVPELVENLLGLMTGLENEMVNYLYLNASKYNIEEHEIDSRRLAGVRTGPLMEAIERCLDGVDDATMTKLVTSLQNAMRAAVGVPSKAGCALTLVSLATRRAFIFRPHADTFLNAIPKYISDRNETVSQSYAAALGYVARGASDESVLKTAALAKRLYFVSGDEKSRLTSGEVVRAVAKYSTDRFNALGSEFLPFIFFARHDDNKDVRKIFTEVWNDNTGGPRAASLYIEDITQLASSHLKSASHTIKHAAALTMTELVSAVSAAQGSIAEKDARMIWPALQTALAEKSWDGKEKVLEGLTTFVEKAPITTLYLVEEVRKIIVREAKRRNLVYCSYALGSLAKIASADHQGLDMHDEVCGVVEAAIMEHNLDSRAGETDADKMEVDSGQGKDETTADRRLRSSAAQALLRSIRVESASPDIVTRRIHGGLDLIGRLFESSPSPADFQSQLFAPIADLVKKIDNRSEVLDKLTAEASDTVQARLSVLLFQQDVVPESIRLARADVALALSKLISRTNQVGGPTLRRLLDAAAQGERSSAVSERLATALQQLSTVRDGRNIGRPNMQAGPPGNYAHQYASEPSRLQKKDVSDRLPPRSRTGCWTCRRRKVKCDEKRPICGPCERLREYCDYDPRYEFKDDTIKQRSRRKDISEEQCPAWDDTARRSVSQPAARPPDTLPPFRALKEEEHWERKAQSRPSGTYHIVANPQSFAALPEYGGRSSRDYACSASPPVDRTLIDDPNVLLLGRFEAQREGDQPLELEHTASAGRGPAPISPVPHPLHDHSTERVRHARMTLFDPVSHSRLSSSSDWGERVDCRPQQESYSYPQPVYTARQQQQPQQALPKQQRTQHHASQIVGHPSKQYLIPDTATFSLGHGIFPYRSSTPTAPPLQLDPNVVARYQQLAGGSASQQCEQMDWIYDGSPSQDTRRCGDSHQRQGS